MERPPAASDGVPTQMRATSEPATASATSAVARSAPDATTSAISSPMRSSTTGVRPSATIRTFDGATSTPITSCPRSAKHAADTQPT